MTLALTTADLNITINHEPRIMDLRLAEALGLSQHRDIRKLADRHAEALKRFGTVCATVAQTSAKGGRPGKTLWFNLRQALFLATKSEAENAVELTVEMVELFAAVKEGRSPAPQASLPKPNTTALPAPALDRSGLAFMRIGGKVVTVDTKRFRVGPTDRVVRIHFDGRIDVGTVLPDAPNWYGPRGAKETWRKPRRGDPLSATKISSAVQILGVVVNEQSAARH